MFTAVVEETSGRNSIGLRFNNPKTIVCTNYVVFSFNSDHWTVVAWNFYLTFLTTAVVEIFLHISRRWLNNIWAVIVPPFTISTATVRQTSGKKYTLAHSNKPKKLSYIRIKKHLKIFGSLNHGPVEFLSSVSTITAVDTIGRSVISVVDGRRILLPLPHHLL